MGNSPASQPGNKPSSVLDLFKDAIKLDGTIDMRSSYGRAIRSLRNELDADQEQAAAAFLKNDIATYAIIERAIQCHLLLNPESIINAEGLNPLITGDLIKIMEAKRRALNALLELRRKKKGNGKGKNGRDLNAISFD